MSKFILNNWTQPVEDLRNDDRKPEVVGEYAVVSGSRPDKAHVIREIEHLTKPFEEADVVADTTTSWICSCEDTQYNRWGQNGGVPVDYTPCKHITRHFKDVRAESDENQQTFKTPVGDK
jgi:hypothetical protein